MSNVLCSALHPADAPAMDALWEIYCAVIPAAEQKRGEQLEAMCRNDEYQFTAARRGEELVGFAIVFVAREEPLALLEYLAVSESAQGQGVGSALFAASTLRARGTHPDACMLAEVEKVAGSADERMLRQRRQAFYRRNGCHVIAGCDYILPLQGAGSLPQMQLMLWRPNPTMILRRASLHRWLSIIYQRVYGCSANDARLARSLRDVHDPLQLL